jgi:thiol-disulfide isomerase/thioredoxin
MMIGPSSRFGERNMRKVLPPSGLLTLGFVALMLWSGPKAQAGPDPQEKGPPAAPEFAKDTEWLQSKPLTVAGLRGQVVVVHFWTFGCINCIHNYPAYKAWQEKFAGKGVTVVGIHSPETKGEADVKRVRASAEKNGLKFAIAVDNRLQNWKNWNNRYWPTIYLIDKQGRVRYRWEGELDFGTTKGERLMRQRIEELLAEKD